MEIPGPANSEASESVLKQSDSVAYPNNEFAEKILKAATSVELGEDMRLVPVTNPELAKAIKESGLGKDSRIAYETSDDAASTSEGLDFDPQKMRSQTFAIYEHGAPVGVTAFIIAPKQWVAKARYFQREPGGIRITDAHQVVGPELPNFYIIPGWTQLKGERPMTPSMYKSWRSVLDVLFEAAPEGTWVENVPQGMLIDELRSQPNGPDKAERIERVKTLKKLELGTFVPFNELPFDMSVFGVNGKGSNATATVSRRLGLAQVPNIADATSFGPVFAKRVK